MVDSSHPELCQYNTAMMFNLCYSSWNQLCLLMYKMAFVETEVSKYLTHDEACAIDLQFQKAITQPTRQVMWTGVPRDWVQHWADRHHMWTLTSAMGPLMDSSNPLCLKKHKTGDEWSRYVKGTSAVFASYAGKCETVTVLARPPPTRTAPMGHSTYQEIEEPILKYRRSDDRFCRIDMIHFTVIGAENARYQVWPTDEVDSWLQSHARPFTLHKTLAKRECVTDKYRSVTDSSFSCLAESTCCDRGMHSPDWSVFVEMCE